MTTIRRSNEAQSYQSYHSSQLLLLTDSFFQPVQLEILPPHLNPHVILNPPQGQRRPSPSFRSPTDIRSPRKSIHGPFHSCLILHLMLPAPATLQPYDTWTSSQQSPTRINRGRISSDEKKQRGCRCRCGSGLNAYRYFTPPQYMQHPTLPS